MKRFLSAALCLAVVAAFSVAGCGPQKADSSRQAIDTAKAMPTNQEKVDYLVGQAKTFINSDQFQGAIDIAQYILQYLDKDNAQARSLLEQAKNDLLAQGKQAAEDLKKQFSGFGQ